MQARLTFRGNVKSSGISGCWIHAQRQPGERVRVLAAPALRAGAAPQGARSDAMGAAGWPAFGARSWEVAPADAAAVGAIIDAIQILLDMSRVPAHVAWHLAPWIEDRPQPGEAPADEPWQEDATESAVRQRIARLSRLRGGRVLVRFAGPSAVIALSARRSRGAVVVDAELLADEGAGGPPWSAHWTVPEAEIRSTPLVGELDEALWRFSPPGSGRRLAVRLEQQEAAKAHAMSYAFFAGWLFVAFPFALVAWLLATPDSTGLMGLFAAVDVEGAGLGAWLAIVAVGMSALAVGAAAAWLADVAAARLGWRYASAETLEVVVAALGGLVYLGAVLAVGDAWALATALPWVLAIGVPVAIGVLRLLRPGG
jgi:hypothetical protein